MYNSVAARAILLSLARVQFFFEKSIDKFFLFSPKMIAADKNLNEKNGPASKQLTMSTSPSSNSDTPSSSSPSSAEDSTDQMQQDENAQTPSELTDEPEQDRLDQLDSPLKQVKIEQTKNNR